MKKEIVSVRKDIKAMGLQRIGKNRIPPFNDPRWTIHPNATIISPYHLELVPTSAFDTTSIILPIEELEIGIISFEGNGLMYLQWLGENETFLGNVGGSGASKPTNYVVDFKENPSAKYLRIQFSNGNNTTESFTVKNIQLEEGNGATLFQPYIEGYKPEKFIERIKAKGFISEMRIRFYIGQERELQIECYVLHKGEKREDLISYMDGTEPYITGEEDYFQFPVHIEVDYDDELIIEAKNVSWNEELDIGYDYTAVVDVVINYYPDEEVKA